MNRKRALEVFLRETPRNDSQPLTEECGKQAETLNSPSGEEARSTPAGRRTPLSTSGNGVISESVGQQMGQLLADLGVDGLAELLTVSLSPADIKKLTQQLAASMPANRRAT